MKRSTTMILAQLFAASALFGAPGDSAPTLPAERTVAIQTQSQTADSALAELGAVLIERDAIQSTWRVPVARLAAARARVPMAVRPEQDALRVRGRVLDTESARLASSAVALTPERRIKVLQTAGRPQDRDLAAITGAGVRILSSVPENGYIVWSPDAERDGILAEIAAEHGWRYLGDFQEDWKFTFEDTGFDTDAAFPLELQLVGSPEEIAADMEKLSADAMVQRQSGALFETAVVRGRWGTMKAILPSLPTVFSISRVGGAVPLGESSGLILANQTEVVGSPAGEVAKVPTASSATDPPYIEWLREKLRLDQGSEENPAEFPLVAVVDNGIGSGSILAPLNLDALNPAGRFGSESTFRSRNGTGMAGPSRIDFSWRVEDEPSAIRDFEVDSAVFDTPTSMGNAVSHGNFAASVLAGNVPDRTARNVNDTGFQFGMGVSPWNRLGNVRFTEGSPSEPDTAGLSPRIAAMLTAIFEDGIDAAGATNLTPAADERFQVLPHRTIISTNSWAMIDSGDYHTTYTLVAQEYDRAARKAMPYSATDPRSFGYRGVFSVAAGGNSGSTYTIHNPALAKNVMAVGGSGHTCQEFEWTELQRNILTSTDPEYEYKGPYTNLLPCSGNSRNFDANSIWDASSSGSTSYARIKPDVVAPAQLVTGNIESY